MQVYGACATGAASSFGVYVMSLLIRMGTVLNCSMICAYGTFELFHTIKNNSSFGTYFQLLNRYFLCAINNQAGITVPINIILCRCHKEAEAF